MKSALTVAVSVLLSIVVVLAVVKTTAPTESASVVAAGAQSESVYDRVIRTGIIRCGYMPSPLYLEVEPNTKQISGLVYDFVTQLAKNLGLKVEWTEEVGRGDFIAALEANRFDVYCTTISINAERARRVNYILPHVIDRFDPYVRIDDARFDENVMAINNKEIRIVAKEGDIFGKIAQRKFPEAQLIELPQLSAETDPMLYLDTGKADVVLNTPMVFSHYSRNNPNRIRKVKMSGPFVFGAEAMAIKAGDYRFERMLSLASTEMQGNGQMQEIYQKYDPEEKLFMRPAKVYAPMP